MTTAKGISVLVVDDEPASLSLTKEYLERSGFAVTGAPSAAAGRELARSRPFDAIVSDYIMPEMNGVELLKAIRAEDIATPFVLFTGRGREEVAVEALNNGADFYLHKGFEPESTYALLSREVQNAVHRRRAEEALKENEARFRSLFENIDDRFQLLKVLRDEDGEVRDMVILNVNPAYERFVGKKAGELVGKSIRTVIPDQDPAWMALFGEIEESGTPKRGRSYDKARDRYYDTLIFRSAKGQVGTICRDVTEQVKAQERARKLIEETDRQKAQLETILEALPVGIGISDATGKVIMLNDNIDVIWRGKAPRPKGFEEYGAYKAWWADTGKELAPEDWGVYRALKNGETSLGEVIRIQRFDGTLGTILHSATPTRDGAGRIEGAIGVIQDITDKVTSDKALRDRAEELRRSNAELQQFAYVASHDLKEPLRMVTSYLQLLEKKDRDNLDERSRGYLRFAVDGAKRMNDLIDDLLAYSRVGTNTMKMAPTNMNEIVDIVLGDLKSVIDENGADIAHDELPTIMADRTQMVQLFLNLVGNAIKFRGLAPPRVRVSAEVRGTEWVFSVQDNGIGIPKDQQDRLFQMFQRLHTREEYPGTGIGLAICKKIVERHGGNIWVESERGEGATFSFSMVRDSGM